MAFTPEQENALLALLDEPLVTLNELPKAANIEDEDLFLTRQDTTERAVTGNVMKDYFASPATLEKRGTVQLTNDANSDNEEKAVTPKGMKTSLANYLPLSGGNLDGILQVPRINIKQGAVWRNINFINSKNRNDAGLEVSENGDIYLYVKDELKPGQTTGVAKLKPNGDFEIQGNTNILPVGIPQPWPTETPPPGWFKCNGAAFDKTNYPELAKAYPSGFLPDLRGEFIRGWDDGRGIDAGRGILSWQEDAFQGHWHNLITGLNDSGNYHYQGGSKGHVGAGFQQNSDAGNGWIRDASTDSINGDPRITNETRPRNIAFLYIVRAA